MIPTTSETHILSFRRTLRLAYCTKGDINGDRKINAVDASAILSDYSRVSTSGISAFTQLQNNCSDINGDKSINAVDASCVLAYYAFVSCGGKDSIDKYIKNEVLKNVR